MVRAARLKRRRGMEGAGLRIIFKSRTRPFLIRRIRLNAAMLTLEDTAEFFNLVLELKPDAREKKDLVAFLRVL